MKTLALGFALAAALMFAPVAVAADSGNAHPNRSPTSHSNSTTKKGPISSSKKGLTRGKCQHRHAASGAKGKPLGKPGKKIAKPSRHPSTSGPSKTGKTA